MLKIEDKNGHIVTLNRNGIIEIELNSSYKKFRIIGKIYNKILYLYRGTHNLHYKTNSLGFNATLIENDFGFDFIELDYNNVLYFFPKQVLIDNSFYLQFKNTQAGNSYELQKFLNVEIIKKYKK